MEKSRNGRRIGAASTLLINKHDNRKLDISCVRLASRQAFAGGIEKAWLREASVRSGLRDYSLA